MRILYFVTIIKKYKVLKAAHKVSKVHVKQYAKSHLGDNVTPLTENTLLGRMLVYLNSSADRSKGTLTQLNDSKIIESVIHGKTRNLHNLDVEQIIGLFHSVNTSILSHNRQNLRKVLNLLDIECCLRINSMEPKNILKLLSAFMHVVPNRITEYKFYQQATEDIDNCLKFTTKKELLQFIFYVGLQKKTKKAQIMLRKCLRGINKEFLESLTVEDLCIICNSAYRTNTKLSNVNLLEKIKQTLNENLSLLKDPALLITLIKTIKHNRYQDEDLLSTISCTVFFNNTVQYYTFTALCHILSLYADYLYYDEQLLHLFSDKCIKQLRESDSAKSKHLHLSEQLRAKDITKFLRAIAVLGYMEIDQKVFTDVIIPKIKERMEIGTYKNSAELVDCVLYLWLLNYRAKELLPSVLSQENITAIRESRTKSRDHLNLLLTAIEYEDRRLFENLQLQLPDSPSFNLTPQIQSRPLLQRVFRTVKMISPAIKLCQTKMNCQIPYLNIVGIIGYKEGMNEAVNIEVLDEYTCVKNKNLHLSGFMQLKLRILERLAVPLIVVEQEEISSMTDLELREFLEDEIKLFC